MEEHLNNVGQAPAAQEESSIDFRKIFKDMRKHKMKYMIVMVITFVVVAILSLAMPNYYKCTVKLSPEMSSSRSSSSMMALAQNFGVTLPGGGAGGMGTEALFPTLYPEVVNSTDFRVSLFQIPVTLESKRKNVPPRMMTYFEYLDKEQKSPWWGKVISAPFIFLGKMLSKKEVDTLGSDSINPFRLTKKQAFIAKIIGKKIECEVDKKTMVITIEVTDQNPLVCAVIADSVKVHLQKFITDYRTSKARGDLAYSKTIYQEAKGRYENARREYSRYVDANNNVILQTVRQKQVDLENELQIQYNYFMQMGSQVISAEAKVQEETPAFTTIQSASVPVKKAGPSRSKICLIWVFLAFLAVTAWVFYKEDDYKMLFGQE